MIVPLKKKVRLKQTQVTKINLYIYVHMYLVRHAPRPRHYDSTCGVMAKSMKITSWWTCVANLIGWKILFVAPDWLLTFTKKLLSCSLPLRHKLNWSEGIPEGSAFLFPSQGWKCIFKGNRKSFEYFLGVR